MKVLYVVTSGILGGAQKYVLELSKHIQGNIISATDSPILGQHAHAQGTTHIPLENLVREISPIKDIKAIYELRSLIKLHKPNIVHLNSSKAGLLGSFACIRLPSKIVYTAHGFVFKERTSLLKKLFYICLEWLASKFRNATICVSEEDTRLAKRFHLAKANTLFHIPNGIDHTHLLDKQEARKKLNLDPEDFLFGTIANFFPSKGLDILITAAKIFLTKNPNTAVHFVTIGEGILRSSLETKIREANIEDRFILTGYIENANTYLSAFDAFIIPSIKEGMPFALLEAISAKLPVIASSLAANKEVLGEAGLYFRTNDPISLANTITEIYQNPAQRAALSELSTKRSSLFTQGKMLAQTKQVYEALLYHS